MNLHRAGTLRFLGIIAMILAMLSGIGCRKPAAPATTSAEVSVSPTPDPQPKPSDLAARMKALQAEVTATEAALTERYRTLEARRKTLPANDAAALEGFNRDAATYTRDRAAFTARQEELKRTQEEETRARLAAAEAERPAMELLGRLRAAIVANDFAAQAQLMGEALARHRTKAAFAEISAVARPQLERVNLAMIQRVAAARLAPSAPPATATGAPLAALRALINTPVQPVPKGEGRFGSVDFHLNPSLPPLDYANVTKAQLLAERKVYPYAFLQPTRHPQLWYRGDDIEFNLLLKPYYQDQTLPTKRLSDADYDRIVALSREIAKETAPAAASAAPIAVADPAQVWALFQRLQRDWPK